jgi:hypothetical protein
MIAPFARKLPAIRMFDRFQHPASFPAQLPVRAMHSGRWERALGARPQARCRPHGVHTLSSIAAASVPVR